MLELFKRCLNANYIHTAEGGDYAIETEGNISYLLFEWSDGLEDWKNNLNFRTVKIDRGEPWFVHRGFANVWNAMKQEVLSEINLTIKRKKVEAVLCIGYSHGAALSLLAQETLAGIFGKTLHIEGYGFGCPRVVKGKLPKEVEARLQNFYTIRNVPDIVTHLPPAAFGFRHIHMIEIGEKGKYGPVKAHTSQAYINELSQFKSAPSIPSIPRTRFARV